MKLVLLAGLEGEARCMGRAGVGWRDPGTGTAPQPGPASGVGAEAESVHWCLTGRERKGRTEVSSLDLENKYKISRIHTTTLSLPELATEASSPHAS